MALLHGGANAGHKDHIALFKGEFGPGGQGKGQDAPIDAIAAKGVNVYAFDAIDIALKLGNAKAANVALLGVAAKVIGFEYEQWTDAIKQTVKPKFIELNLNAFKEGYSKF